MSQEMIAKAVYVVGKEHIRLVDYFGFTDELAEHLLGDENQVLRVDGDTHLAKFVRGGPTAGWLKNTMSGSTFKEFSFAKATLEGVTVVVATYT